MYIYDKNVSFSNKKHLIDIKCSLLTGLAYIVNKSDKDIDISYFM